MAKLVRNRMVVALPKILDSQLAKNQHCDMHFPINFVALDTHEFQLRVPN